MLTPLVVSYCNFLLLIQQCLVIPQQKKKLCMLCDLLKRSNKIQMSKRSEQEWCSIHNSHWCP
jgi:hypothetical protein